MSRFVVGAGSYERVDGKVVCNYQFSASFETFEQALAAWAGVNTYPWADIIHYPGPGHFGLNITPH